MRQTISNFASTFADMLGHHHATDKAGNRQEDIRTAMLAALSEIESTHPDDFSTTLVTITRASDVQSLWYARSELLRLIADREGEQAANKILDSITVLFMGLIPPSQMPSKKRGLRTCKLPSGLNQ
jgi:hypothetical protein